jgi:ribosomal-protein-alanine N-acetyltransferase
MRIACDEDRAPFGFVLGRRIAEIVEIDLLGVAPERRREGCATALLEDLIEREVSRGAEELRLELRESNQSAHALYARLGFVVVGTRSRYYPDGENAMLLTRRTEPPRSLEPPIEPGTES